MDTQQLLSIFNGLIEQHKLDLKVDELPPPFKGPVALDVEHDEAGNFVGVGFTDNGTTIYYFSDLLLFSRINFCSVSLICHNGRTDFDCLRNWGIGVSDNQLFWDTELFSHIQDSSLRGYGLKSLAERGLGIVYPSYEDIVGKRTKKQSKERCTLDKQPLELVSKYNCLDVFATWKLYEKQYVARHYNTPKSIKEYFEQIERPIGFILSDMENRGICVDLNYLSRLKTSLEEQKKPFELQIKNELGNINLNSPKQLLEALNAQKIYPILNHKPSTDKRALDSFRNIGVISYLLRYGELDTLLNNFVLRYLTRNESIIHPWFNQCGTRTGRLSCSNPNLLQIPKRTENGRLVRRMFIPRSGMLLGDCDFGQIEPRVLAHLSKDPVLCKMFNDGIDFHTFTADRLSISRDRAKVLNLSVGYRATKYSVQRQLGGTLEDSQREIDRWWALFPQLQRWQDSLIWSAKRSGFCTTLLGRRIKVYNLNESNIWKREAAERQLINNITQGSAAEIMKLAMIKIQKEINEVAGFNPLFGLLIQVYDELVFETPDIEDVELVKRCMETCIKLDVPLTVDCKIGGTWADCR